MYRIKNVKNLRSENKYIVISPMRNLYINNTSIRHSLIEGATSTYKYTWGEWQNYFLLTLRKPTLPNHYYVELLDKDYVIYKGLSHVNKSYFLEDLSKCRAIPYKYENAILITVDFNLLYEPLDMRMVQHLNDKLLSGLMAEYNISRDNIKYINEILQPHWIYNIEQMMGSTYYKFLVDIDKKYIDKYIKLNIPFSEIDSYLQKDINKEFNMERIKTRLPRYHKGKVPNTFKGR